MKKLMLMRHAKSSWAETDATDIERTLGERGRAAAAQLGEWIEAQDLIPDQVIVSNATRCQETWQIVSSKLSTQPAAVTEPGLYMAGVDGMLDIIRDKADGDRVLVIGHQPSIGSLSRALRVDPAPNHESFEKYPTGATTVLDFDTTDWRQVDFGGGEFDRYVAPSQLA